MQSVPAPSDLRAHAVQVVGQGDDLGLSGRVEDARGSTRARVAAIKMFSVPPTVGKSRWMSAPTSSSTSPWIMPFFSSKRQPRASRPRRCRSMGRVPMAQPPGRDTRASPHRASKRAENEDRRPHLANDVVGRFAERDAGRVDPKVGVGRWTRAMGSPWGSGWGSPCGPAARAWPRCPRDPGRLRSGAHPGRAATR